MEWTKINVDKDTHIKLLYLSKITGLSMAEIMRQIMSNITAISCMYSRGATLSIEHRVTASQITLTLRGESPTFCFGTAKNDAEVRQKAEAYFEGAKQ